MAGMPDVFHYTTDRNGKSMGCTEALAGRLLDPLQAA